MQSLKNSSIQHSHKCRQRTDCTVQTRAEETKYIETLWFVAYEKDIILRNTIINHCQQMLCARNKNVYSINLCRVCECVCVWVPLMISNWEWCILFAYVWAWASQCDCEHEQKHESTDRKSERDSEWLCVGVLCLERAVAVLMGQKLWYTSVLAFIDEWIYGVVGGSKNLTLTQAAHQSKGSSTTGWTGDRIHLTWSYSSQPLRFV